MEIEGKKLVLRIDEQRAKLGLSRKDIVIAGGLKSVQSFADWNNGSIPEAKTVLCIADKLGVSIRWLLTGVDEKGLSLEERNLIIKYNSLDNYCKHILNQSLDAMLDVPEKKETAG